MLSIPCYEHGDTDYWYNCTMQKPFAFKILKYFNQVLVLSAELCLTLSPEIFAALKSFFD